MPTLMRLLGGVSRDVYERVFAVGLAELQELASLHCDEVSRCIYQISLGEDGERVFAGLARAQEKRNGLLGTEALPGELQHWQQQLQDLDRKLATRQDAEARHDTLEQERAGLAD